MTDLATIGLRADVTQLQNAVRELNNLADQGDKTESRVTKSLNNMKGAYAALAGVVAAGGIANKLMETERQTGILTSSLKTVTGSAKGAQEAFEAIQVLASQLPESVNDVTTAFTIMANRGLEPSEAAIKSYSNTAAAMGKDLMQMVEAVADAATMQFTRLEEFGIDAKQDADSVAFTFQGVTTRVEKNADAISGYLRALGDVNFAGASADRMAELDGTLSNLGDTWDGLFRTINSAGAGELMAKGAKMATEAIQSLNDFIKSGQLSGYIDAIGERFSWVWDIAASGVSTVIDAIHGLYGMWYMASDKVLGAVGSSTDEYFAAIRDGFLNAPENIKAFIQIITVELASLVDKAKAYGETIGYYLNPKNLFNDVKAPDLTSALDAINSARVSSIESIFDEKKAAKDSYDSQIQSANDLRTALEMKNKESKKEILGQYKKGGEGGGLTEAQLDAQKKAAKEAAKAEKDRLDSINNIIAALEDENRQLTMTAEAYQAYQLGVLKAGNSQIAAAEKIRSANQAIKDQKQAVEDYQKSIDEITKSADDFGGAWSRTGSVIVDAFGSMSDSLNDYISQMDELQSRKEKIAQAEANPNKTAADSLKLQKERLRLEQDTVKTTLSGYGKMAGAAASMFSEQSKGRKALNNAEKVFAAIEIGLAMQKAAANATNAIASAFSAPFPVNFAAGAAMIGIMAGLGLFGGGSGGGAPSAEELQSSQGTGTVMGDPTGKSDSILNAIENYSDIGMDQLSELRGIRDAMQSLNSGITSLAISLIRGGKFDSASANLAGGQNVKLNLGGAFGGLLDTVLGSVFGSTSKKLTDTGLQIGAQDLGDVLAGGFNAFYYNTVETTKKKLYGLIKNTSTNDELTAADGALVGQFTEIFGYIGGVVTESLSLLGVESLGAIEDFKINIGKISFKDLSGEEIQKELEAVFGAQADLLAKYVLPQITEYQRIGEGAFETLTRVAKEQAVFNDAMDMLGMELLNVKKIIGVDIPSAVSALQKIDIAQAIIGMMGGLEEFSAKTSEYVDKFFTESEKTKLLGDSLAEVFSDLGKAVPSTREEFRGLIESLNLTKDADQKLFASLMELVPSMDEYLSAIEKETKTKEKATTATKDYAAIAAKQADMQIQLLEAQGFSSEALAARRAKELSMLDESLRPLQEQIWAQQDLNKAMLEAARAADEAARIAEDAAKEKERIEKESADNILRIAEEAKQKAEMIANERYGLETQLLQLMGDENALRQRQLATLDESNRPLQEQIWAIEDKAAADAKAAEAAQKAADASQKLADDKAKAEQDASDRQQKAYEDASRAAQDAAEEQARLIKQTQDYLTGAIKKLRGESESLNDLDRQRAKNTLNAALAAAQSGQSIIGFAGLEDAVSKISELDKSQFVSFEDYQRELGRTLSILDRLSVYAGMPTSSTNPIISNGALAMQTQTNQQMSTNIEAVEDQMTKLTEQIEDNTKRTKMMLERWEAIGMPVSRTA